LVVILAASYALIGCGSGTSGSTQAVSPLTGNWNLFGNRALQRYPSLSLAIVVNGNQISALGDGFAQCPNLSGGGGSAELTGLIAADGTFELSDAGSNDSFIFSVTGTVPAQGSSTWAGTYMLTNSPAYTGCTLNQTAPFTATAFTPLDGTYTGTFVEGTSSASSTGSAAVSLTVSQDPAVISYPRGLPLTATITVTGFPCFTHGTSSTLPGGSVVEGDLVAIMFNMDDGSQVGLIGDLASTDASVLSMASLEIFSGQCSPGGAFGTLTRQ
jgi:hypothetical protein